MTNFNFILILIFPISGPNVARGAAIVARAGLLCGRGGQGHGQEKGLGQSPSGGEICSRRRQKHRHQRRHAQLQSGAQERQLHAA